MLVIGLDAAEPSLIQKWKDDLPNLSRIMREGVCGRMRSSDPPLSVPAWNCLCTGKNPGKIGVFDFFYRKKDSYAIKIVDSTAVRAPTVWRILGENGKKVVVIGVPLTFPPEEVKGLIVSGIPLPAKEGRPLGSYTYPAELSETIDKLVGGYEYALSFNIPEDFSVNNLSWATSTLAQDLRMQGLSKAEEKQLQVAKHLLQNSDWDYFMVVFRELDRVGHFMWKYMDETHPQFKDCGDSSLGDVIRRVYMRMDNIVGELMTLAGNDVIVLVVSDHGIGPLHRRFFVNEFLQRINMLKLKAKKRLTLRISQRLKFRAPEIMQLLLRVGLHRIVTFMPRKLRGMVRSIDQFEASVEAVDWSKTKAYSFGEVGRVFLNVKGREPQGIVQPGEEYEQIRNIIIQKLEELTDPATGAKIVDKALKREEIYFGEFLESAPDILFYMDGFKCITSTRLGYPTMFENEKLTSGTHRPYGIFMAYGKDVRKGASIDVDICDVTPTVLHIMGLRIPHDMDGRVLLDIFEPDSETCRRPVAHEKYEAPKTRDFEWSPEEEKKVREQLGALGYLG